jgi:hypothetical protein
MGVRGHHPLRAPVVRGMQAARHAVRLLRHHSSAGGPEDRKERPAARLTHFGHDGRER